MWVLSHRVPSPSRHCTDALVVEVVFVPGEAISLNHELMQYWHQRLRESQDICTHLIMQPSRWLDFA